MFVLERGRGEAHRPQQRQCGHQKAHAEIVHLKEIEEQVLQVIHRDSVSDFLLGHSAAIGSNSILGDTRWAGYYGVEADFIAADNCKICSFLASDIKVLMIMWLETCTLTSRMFGTRFWVANAIF